MTDREKKALDGIRKMLCYAIFMIEQGKVHPDKMNLGHVEKLLDMCRKDFEGSLRFASIWEDESDE